MNILGEPVPDDEFARLGVYNSFGFTNARYVSGEFSGNYVEYAPKYVERLGIDCALGSFSMNESILAYLFLLQRPW